MRVSLFKIGLNFIQLRDTQRFDGFTVHDTPADCICMMVILYMMIYIEFMNLVPSSCRDAKGVMPLQGTPADKNVHC